MSRAEDLFSRIEAVGEAYVDELIDSRKSEESFLDFKRSANHGATSKLHEDDRKNLSKALSGFSNSEGGVILWGVDCSSDPAIGDVAKAKKPLQNPTRFVSLLENAVSGCTIPAVQGCRSIAIPAGPSGFAATLIPRSPNAPHQVTKDSRYLIRAGSNFQPVPHAVLAGLFGRHPQPVVYPNFKLDPVVVEGTRISIKFDVVLANGGSVVAEDLFLSVFGFSNGGVDCKLSFSGRALYAGEDPAHFLYTSTMGIDFTAMGTRDFRLPPGAFIQVMSATWVLNRSPVEGLNLKIIGGCAGQQPHEQVFLVSQEKLAETYQYAFERWSDASARLQVDWHKVAATLLGQRPHWT